MKAWTWVTAVVTVCVFAPSNAFECACAKPLSTLAMFDSSDIVFWGTLENFTPLDSGEVLFEALVHRHVKGCLDEYVERLELVVPCTHSLPAAYSNHLYLISGTRQNVQALPQEINLRLSLTACDFITPKESISDFDFLQLSRQTEKCRLGTDNDQFDRCVDNSMPFDCKANIVCGSLPKVRQVCPHATKCVVNRCNGCNPMYFDKLNQRVCEGREKCPGNRTPVQCKNDSCLVAKTASGFDRCSAAERCLSSHQAELGVFSCTQCQPQFLDGYGAGVCTATTPTSRCVEVSGISFTADNCAKQQFLGYGLNNGFCEQIKGCKGAPGSELLFADAQTCVAFCKCPDISQVDFGDCGLPLGFYHQRGVCRQLFGCPAKLVQQPILSSGVFTEYKQCSNSCIGTGAVPFFMFLNPPTQRPTIGQTKKPTQQPTQRPTKLGQPPTAPPTVPQIPKKMSAGASVVVAAEILAYVAKTAKQCGSVPPVSCDVSTCINSTPKCPEAYGKVLKCEVDNCGACTATWTNNGAVFVCQRFPRSCDPAVESCCPANRKPWDCSAASLQLQCRPDMCVGAVKCQHDPCDECSTTFLDANNTIIPFEVKTKHIFLQIYKFSPFVFSFFRRAEVTGELILLFLTAWQCEGLRAQVVCGF